MPNKQEFIFDDGVFYRHGENGSSVWLEYGDEKKDGRYIGEIDNGDQMVREQSLIPMEECM